MKEVAYILLGFLLFYIIWEMDFPSYRVSEHIYTDSTFYTVDFKSKLVSSYSPVTDFLTSADAKRAYDSLTNGEKLNMISFKNHGINFDGSYSDPVLEKANKEQEEGWSMISFIFFNILIPLGILYFFAMAFIRSMNGQPIFPWL